MSLNLTRTPTEANLSSRLDWIGASASMLCAIHCALLPLVITLLPMSGLAGESHLLVDLSLLVVSLTVAMLSLRNGYLKHHHRWGAIRLAIAGFLVLFVGIILHEEAYGRYVMALGGTLVAVSHIWNARLCKHCRRCNDHAHA